VLVRPLARAIAVSPPLTADREHFAMIAEALENGLNSLAA
jgi:adenosylmethionine-8-amino-7-oxononanoate aminotransferase